MTRFLQIIQILLALIFIFLTLGFISVEVKWTDGTRLKYTSWRTRQRQGGFLMSNYEIYAEKRQKELLEESRSLNQCIELIKKNSKILSTENINNQIDLIAALFDLTPGEVERAVKGQEYWCI